MWHTPHAATSDHHIEGARIGNLYIDELDGKILGTGNDSLHGLRHCELLIHVENYEIGEWPRCRAAHVIGRYIATARLPCRRLWLVGESFVRREHRWHRTDQRDEYDHNSDGRRADGKHVVQSENGI